MPRLSSTIRRAGFGGVPGESATHLAYPLLFVRINEGSAEPGVATRPADLRGGGVRGGPSRVLAATVCLICMAVARPATADIFLSNYASCCNSTVQVGVVSFSQTTRAFRYEMDVACPGPGGVMFDITPYGMALGPDGYLDVAENDQGLLGCAKVVRFNQGTGAYVNDLVPPGTLRFPQAVLWGPDGNLYVADGAARDGSQPGSVAIFDSTGNLLARITAGQIMRRLIPLVWPSDRMAIYT